VGLSTIDSSRLLPAFVRQYERLPTISFKGLGCIDTWSSRLLDSQVRVTQHLEKVGCSSKEMNESWREWDCTLGVLRDVLEIYLLMHASMTLNSAPKVTHRQLELPRYSMILNSAPKVTWATRTS
jgi:hypothetical protein